MPNPFWNEAPFARLLFPFLIGIVTYFTTEIWSWKIYVLFAICFGTFILVVFKSSSKFKFVNHRLIALLIFLQLFFAGYSLAYQSLLPYTSSVNVAREQQAVAIITTNPILKNGYYTCKFEVIEAQDPSCHKQPIQAKLQLIEREPSYGDTIWFRAQIKPVSTPLNPFQFDYQKYLKYQNIRCQTFVSNHNWKIVGESSQKTIYHVAYKVQKNVSRIIDAYFQNKSDKSILKALIIGDKTEVTAETKESFTSTGTMHLLAVSGLHVGIIYLLLQWVLGLLLKQKFQLLLVCISLLALWMFALITGFTPSVCRACFMFSLMAIGKHFHKNANIYNTIAVSAFILLAINPLFIMQLGFQFSYLAVIGIIVFQKPIHQTVQTSSWFVSKAWSLTSVSIAAQIATLPLGLLYFGQFPNYFMLSNLLVIPYISVIIYGSLLVCLLSPFGQIATVISTIVEAYLWFIQQVLTIIETLPYSVFEAIHITWYESLFMYLSILFLALFINQKRRTTWFVLMLVGVLGVCFSVNLRWLQNQNSQELIFFELSKETQLVYRNADQAFCWAIQPEGKYWESSVYPYLNTKGVDVVKFDNDPINQSTIRAIGNFKILLINGKCELPITPVDVIYLRQLFGLDWQKITSLSPIIYFDKAIPAHQTEKWLAWLEQQDWNNRAKPKVIQGFYRIPVS